MEGSLVFVHGTGDWGERRLGVHGQLDATVMRIRAGLQRGGLEGVEVIAPPWARDCAPQWPDVLLALPPKGSTRAVAGGDGDAGGARDVGLWELLALDPLLELRLAGLASAAEVSMVPGVAPPEATVADLVHNAAPSADELEAGGVDPVDFAAAAQRVAGSEELSAAARAAGSAASPELLDMATRAILAELIAGSREPTDVAVEGPRFVIDAAVREVLIADVRRALAEGTYRGLVPSAIREALLTLAARVGTGWAVPRRGTWMDPVTSFTTDIAFYLRHGDEVRDYLRDKLRAVPPPVVVLGHSLGGVAMVDLLSSADRPDVGLLVTAGSQAPYLFMLDALDQLRPARSEGDAGQNAIQPVPGRRPFTPWLNIYDRRDLLAFCAQRVFPGPGVEDVAIDAGVPFPEVHSAYWEVPEVWEAVARAWPR